MNKIDALKHLVSLLRDEHYDSASLLLISDGRIITGRPVFNDSGIPGDPPHASAMEIFDFVKRSQLCLSDPTALVADKDGFLLENVSVEHSPENVKLPLLYVFFDSVSNITIIP